MEVIKKYSPILFFFILLILATYQDFPLINTFGEIARSPIVFISPLFLIYIFSHKTIKVSKNLSYLIYYYLYVSAISLVYLAIVYISNNYSFSVLYENIIIKNLKMMVYPLIGIIFYQFVYMYLKQLKKPFHTLFNALLWLQLFTLVWLVFETYFLKTQTIFIPQIHSTAGKYWRIRLWTLEESWTGTILILITFFPLFFLSYAKVNKFKRILSISCSVLIFMLYIAVSESKGFLVLVLLGILPLVFNYIKKNPRLKKLTQIASIAMFIIIIIGVISLHNVFYNTFFTSITFGTRFTSIYASLDTFIHSVIGVGYSGFVYFYPKAIENAINTGLFNSLELSEIERILSTTKALSSKSEFFDQLMYGGVFYLYFFYQFFIRRLKYFLSLNKDQNIFLIVPLIFITLAGVVYITFQVKYEIWLFLAFLDFIQDYFSKNEEHQTN